MNNKKEIVDQKECIKRWKSDHKDEIKQYNAEYYRKNKEHIKTLVSQKKHCDVCNCTVNKCKWNRHILTTKHLQNIGIQV